MRDTITNNLYFPYMKKKRRRNFEANRSSKLKPKQSGFISDLINKLYRVIQYILNSPEKALTLGLAGQVVGSNALNHFNNSTSTNSNHLGDAVHLNNLYYDYDDLVLIDDRVDFTPILSILHPNVSKGVHTKHKSVLANDKHDIKNISHSNPLANNYRVDVLEVQIMELRAQTKKQAILECAVAIEEGNSRVAKFKWNYIVALNENSEWYDEDIQKIVKEVYTDSLDNFWKIDRFIHYKLPYIQNEIIGYGALLEEMKQNGQLQTYEITWLSRRIQEYKNRPNYSNMTQKYKDKFESIKSQLEFQSIKWELRWLKACIAKKVDAHAKSDDDDGYTPLHEAVKKGCLSEVQCYKNQGMSIEAKSNYGLTPLHLAAWKGYLSVVQYLKDQIVRFRRSIGPQQSLAHRNPNRRSKGSGYLFFTLAVRKEEDGMQNREAPTMSVL